MNKSTYAWLSAAALLVTPVYAIDIDSTGATVQFAGKDAIQFNNLNVPGHGSYAVRFKWNPASLSFTFDPDSLSLSSQARCTSRVYESDDYQMWSSIRVVNGVEYGGAINVNADITPDNINLKSVWMYDLALSWARTAKAEDNPFLKGRTLRSFDPLKAYGLIAYSGMGFKQGDLVEISGNPEVDNFLIVKQANGSVTTTFKTGVVRKSMLGCVSGTGSYTGYGQTFTSGAVNIAGDVATYTTDQAKLTWNLSSASGTVAANPHAPSVGNLQIGTAFKVVDIGEGLSFIGIDADGKAIATFSTLKR
ncbi:hypothetical protein [Parachitinimonas caeni]|uniref:Uncharacterized protein n=1 Tax=Parachitinimonas caeni TaxID=3031301 RepID=A0ABT7E0V9_9NEIS|nr:hypothetical protein [Parachitinimonas caeni]MDK2125679.1 hypothetical protein [Parachitinimonas caeni]